MKNNELTFKIFNEFDKNLFDSWNELIVECDFYFYQNYNFLEQFHIINKDKNNNNKYYFVTIYQNNNLIAILPLEVRSIYGFRILQWIGSDDFDYCCPIIKNFK